MIGPHVLAHLSAANAAALEQRDFFPNLIAEPFHEGLHKAFAFAIAACLLAAIMSWSRGSRAVARRTARRADGTAEVDIV